MKQLDIFANNDKSEKEENTRTMLKNEIATSYWVKFYPTFIEELEKKDADINWYWKFLKFLEKKNDPEFLRIGTEAWAEIHNRIKKELSKI